MPTRGSDRTIVQPIIWNQIRFEFGHATHLVAVHAAATKNLISGLDEVIAQARKGLLPAGWRRLYEMDYTGRLNHIPSESHAKTAIRRHRTA